MGTYAHFCRPYCTLSMLDASAFKPACSVNDFLQDASRLTRDEKRSSGARGRGGPAHR